MGGLTAHCPVRGRANFGRLRYLNLCIRLRPKANGLISHSSEVLSFFDSVTDIYWLDCHRCHFIASSPLVRHLQSFTQYTRFPASPSVTTELLNYTVQRAQSSSDSKTESQRSGHCQGLRLRIFSTPRTLSSSSEEYVRIEHSEFLHKMTPPLETSLDVLEVKSFFTDEDPSLENHFRLLREF